MINSAWAAELIMTIAPTRYQSHPCHYYCHCCRHCWHHLHQPLLAASITSSHKMFLSCMLIYGSSWSDMLLASHDNSCSHNACVCITHATLPLGQGPTKTQAPLWLRIYMGRQALQVPYFLCCLEDCRPPRTSCAALPCPVLPWLCDVCLQDFKTAHLLGVPPSSQLVAMLLGSAASVPLSVAAYLLYTHAWQVGLIECSLAGVEVLWWGPVVQYGCRPCTTALPPL